MGELNFKACPEFSVGKIYSVCLRGSRTIESFLELYDASVSGSRKFLGNAQLIASQAFKFDDLKDRDIQDNYDPSIRGKSIEELYEKMCSIYQCFDRREIVTIVSFEIKQLWNTKSKK